MVAAGAGTIMVTLAVVAHPSTAGGASGPKRNRSPVSKGTLKAWKKKNPDSILGILGCMAQKDGETFLRRHPHGDLVVGTRDFPKIVDLLGRAAAGERKIVAYADQHGSL